MKEMQGVNNIQEDAMRSFETMNDILTKYSDCGLPEDQYLNLKSGIGSIKTYLKCQYFQNLSWESHILSHCVTCAVSDPNDARFQRNCMFTNEISEKCRKCELIHEIFDVFEGLLDQYKTEMTPHQAAIISRQISDAQVAICAYQTHLVKTFTQDTVWQNLFEKCDPTVAFMTMDWAMKFIPRRYREKQSEWFAKNGIPWHISCVERIIPHKDIPGQWQKKTDSFASVSYTHLTLPTTP